MLKPIIGLHHVTAIASDPQQTLDFYTGILGLRLVKRTVNFDDPGTYHLYFGDDAGLPGTILTFFPWPGMTRGTAGSGEVAATAFSIPVRSLPFWKNRLTANRLVFSSEIRFGEETIVFAGPDGMTLELVGHTDESLAQASRYANVPPEHAIHGFFGVTLLEQESTRTAAMLSTLGFKNIGESGHRQRFGAAGEALGNCIDLVTEARQSPGRLGAGSVHHIAFRAPDDAAQLAWRAEIAKYVDVTPVVDRDYFHSIYFREPGGVLFELATDPPGFTHDEPIETLGEELRIPAWLEPKRSFIERTLPAIELHKEKAAAG